MQLHELLHDLNRTHDAMVTVLAVVAETGATYRSTTVENTRDGAANLRLVLDDLNSFR